MRRYDFRERWRARLWISASRIHVIVGKLELLEGGRGSCGMYIVGNIFSDTFDVQNWVEGSAEAMRLCLAVEGSARQGSVYVSLRLSGWMYLHETYML